jgi:hypothetical protein
MITGKYRNLVRTIMLVAGFALFSGVVRADDVPAADKVDEGDALRITPGFAHEIAATSARPRNGDRIDKRLDRRGDRIDERLDNRGDRIDDRLDNRGDRIDRRLDNRGDRIDRRLDHRGDRANRRFDNRAQRVERRRSH